MRKSHHPPSDLGRSQRQTLKQHRRAAYALPEPGKEWRWGDVDASHQALHRFFETSVIEKTRPIGGSHRGYYWQTRPAAYRYVQDELDDYQIQAPCGNRGIQNPRGREGYTCSNPECDCQFGRETAQEVLQA